jgi:hypothetical protein
VLCLVQATRDDELSVAAGETIIVAGEYKNPGWVWASRINSNGQATGGYRLCPANYLLFVKPPVNDSEAPVAATESLPVSLRQTDYQQLPASASTSSASNSSSCPKITLAPGALGASGSHAMGNEHLLKSNNALPMKSLPVRAPTSSAGGNCPPALVSLCLRALVYHSYACMQAFSL